MAGQWVARAVVRAALLMAWSLVGWGWLLALATLADAAREGPGRALERLLPSTGASLLAWVNALSVLWALAVALVIIGLYFLGVRAGRGDASKS